MSRALISALIGLVVSTGAISTASADDNVPAAAAGASGVRVDVTPVARDHEIQARLASILTTTGWYDKLEVEVRDGVVFLNGTADSDEHRIWAADLARRTQDVAAVVNHLVLPAPSAVNFSPAIVSIRDLGSSVIGALPLVAIALVILIVAWLSSRLTARVARHLLRRRELTPLLREVLARILGGLVFIIGLYVVFRVAGLTTVALSVLGGTGLLGLILGIAFRDISENFLASVFLSLQPPFRNGDLLQIGDHVGYVERLTNRATVLVSLDGNHIQIPNKTVYQSVIRNYTSNPNRREDFVVGIGYDDAITHAQAVAMRILVEHPAVLADPEPTVLVDALGSATVNLRIFYWIDGSAHSWLKVRSSIIRLIKGGFQDNGISMPDEARELVFPNGVPVRMVDATVAIGDAETIDVSQRQVARRPSAESTEVASAAEGGLRNDADELQDRMRRGRTPEEGADLLAKPGTATSK